MQKVKQQQEEEEEEQQQRSEGRVRDVCRRVGC